MSDDPRYSPPGAAVADPAPPQAPARVRTAVRLLWTSFALGIPLAAMALARNAKPEEVLIELLVYVVLFGFSAFLNIKVYRGRNWARWVVFAFMLLGAYYLFFPPEDPTPPTLIETAVNAVCVVVEAVAMWLLFTQPGAAWFRRRD